MSRRGRVLSRNALIAQVNADRAAGHSIAFANGVFDLLHVGHARYLAGARSLGTRLIVGVNGDGSSAAAKGPGRPVVPARDRAALVAALRGVDRVVIFEESTVDALIEELRPAVHAKGTDYREDNVPERGTMRALGGRTAITGDPKTHATRDLVERVRERGAGGA